MDIIYDSQVATYVCPMDIIYDSQVATYVYDSSGGETNPTEGYQVSNE